MNIKKRKWIVNFRKTCLLIFLLILSSFSYADDIAVFKHKNAFALDMFGGSGISVRHKISERNFASFYAYVSKEEDTINSNNSLANILYIDNTRVQILIGIRRYLFHDKVAIFFEPVVIYDYESIDETAGITGSLANESYRTEGLGLGFKLGGEYFVNEQFSIGGDISINTIYSKASGDRSGDSKTISSYDTGVMVNYYF